MNDRPEREARADLAPLLLGLLVLALTLVAAVVRDRPPAPRGLDAPRAEFSAERARDFLRRVLAGEAPHPTGSEEHTAVRRRLLAELSGLGLEPRVQQAYACGPYSNGSTAINVIARVPGRDPEAEAVLLACHYDSVAAGPGAADDGAGIGTLLETARALLAGGTCARDVLLLFTDDEEQGLNGAVAFCEEAPERERVGCVLNFEARGTGGLARMFEVSGPNGRWMGVLARAVRRPSMTSVSEEIYRRMPNDTDLTVFRAHGLHGLNFAFIDGAERYHTPLDDLAHLDAGTLQHMGDQALAIARDLADGERLPDGTHQAVYFDVLGAALVHLPARWVLPGSVLLVLLTGVLTWRVVRAGEAPCRAVLAGATAPFLLAVLLPLLAGLAPRFAALLSAAGEAGPQLSRGLPLHVAAILSALAALFFLGPRYGGRLSVSALWLGVLWPCSGLALLTALVAPGASFLFWIPGTVAALCGLLATLHARGFDGPLGRLAAVLPLVPVGVLWWPIVLGTEVAFRGPGHPAVGIAAAAACAPLLPLFGWWSRRSSQSVWLVALVGILGAGIAAAFQGVSPDAPRTQNLVYHLRHEGEQPVAALIATGSRRPVSAADDAPTWRRERLFEWSPARGFVTDAPVLALPAPTFAHQRDGDTVRGTLRSERRATRLLLALPRAAGPRLRVEGRDMPPNDERMRARFPDHEVFTFDDVTGPIEVEVELEQAGPVEGWLIDSSRGLPAEVAGLAPRPEWVVPIGRGDRALVSRRVTLGAP